MRQSQVQTRLGEPKASQAPGESVELGEKTVRRVLLKLQRVGPLSPATPLLGLYSTEVGACVHQRHSQQCSWSLCL